MPFMIRSLESSSTWAGTNLDWPAWIMEVMMSIDFVMFNTTQGQHINQYIPLPGCDMLLCLQSSHRTEGRVLSVQQPERQ